MKYPKIDTLYKRLFTDKDPVTGEIRYLDKGKSGNPLIEGDYARREFESIKYWTVTEKVNGTNIRIEYKFNVCQGGDVTIHGKNEGSSIPSNLFKYLQKTFPLPKLQEAFQNSNHVILYGEGYGSQIQLPPGKQHNPYGDEVSFILFDSYIDGWWLDVSKVHEVAKKLDIKSVPLLDYTISKHKDTHLPENSWVTTTYIWTEDQIVRYIKDSPVSKLGKHRMEGVVARSSPQLFFKDGRPVMYKLKCRDFDGVS